MFSEGICLQKDDANQIYKLNSDSGTKRWKTFGYCLFQCLERINERITLTSYGVEQNCRLAKAPQVWLENLDPEVS